MKRARSLLCGAVLVGSVALLVGGACAGNRTTALPTEVPVVTREPEPDALGEGAPEGIDAGCARVPRGATCLPAGLAEFGENATEEHFEARPPHAIRVEAFAIDRREVNGRAYQHCVSERQCAPPSCEQATSSRVPVRCVAWADAVAYCAWRGARLPTEVEWERAAAGLYPNHRTYAWGMELPDSGVPRDQTPEGVEQMAGGLAEWVMDGGDFYPALPRIRDASLDGLDAIADVIEEEAAVYERTDSGLYVLDGWQGSARSMWRVVRGGHDGDPLARRTTTLRRFRQPGDRLPWVGFRCVYPQ